MKSCPTGKHGVMGKGLCSLSLMRNACQHTTGFTNLLS